MKPFAVLVALVPVVVFALAQPALGQLEDPNPAYPHLKQFEPLIGEWLSEDGRLRHTFKWVLRKRFLHCERQFKDAVSNEFGTFEILIIGWDSQNETLTQSDFSGGPPGYGGLQALRRLESKPNSTWVSGRPSANIIARPGDDDYVVTTLRLEKKDLLSFKVTVYDSEDNEKNTFSRRLERVK